MKSKRAGKPAFFIVFALILALTYATFFGIENYYGDTRNVYVKGANDIRWGIDISGGVEAVFSPDKADVDITDEDMDAAKSIIETRLVNNNITDYEVYSDSDNHQIIVRFPWAAGESDFDAASAVQELGETALLTFCRNEDSEDVILSGAEDIEKAEAGMDQDGNYVVYLYFTDAGTSKFSAATAELVGSTISIWMDDTMLQAPTVNEAITTGEAYITGMADADAAKSLADKINAGSLPFALTVDNSKLQVISATLGSDALEVMLIAGAVAFGLVCLLMILRYRLNGVVAAIALLGQLAGSVACISGFFPNSDSFTLTIPGIAGIILSIGVGVDCNVIAAERIRDEFKKGKTIDGAIDSGYKNSLSAIIDGNVTIVIVSVVLMGAFGTPDSLIAKLFSPLMSLFGSQVTGSIYSFGYTLLVGTVFNLIMGVLASKKMLRSISQLKIFRNPWFYGGKKNA
ncbi:MAG: protein translocase subunit SecD [Clostridia bacterium]|nr:protein translocase subunit SecD [Clostridia bacterium]MEE1055228.1 protein translocase subunit SecD [Acutalibacteraceae bacterium]